jgi:hypothetical protein
MFFYPEFSPAVSKIDFKQFILKSVSKFAGFPSRESDFSPWEKNPVGAHANWATADVTAHTYWCA